MGGFPPIWCAFTPEFIVWIMVLIYCTLKLIYLMFISVHSDRFHSPLQFFICTKTAAFFSIPLQFDRPKFVELTNRRTNSKNSGRFGAVEWRLVICRDGSTIKRPAAPAASGSVSPPPPFSFSILFLGYQCSNMGQKSWYRRTDILYLFCFMFCHCWRQIKVNQIGKIHEYHIFVLSSQFQYQSSFYNLRSKIVDSSTHIGQIYKM